MKKSLFFITAILFLLSCESDLNDLSDLGTPPSITESTQIKAMSKTINADLKSDYMSNYTTADFKIKNLESIVGNEMRISLKDITGAQDIYLTKKLISKGKVPVLDSFRKAGSSGEERQHWMLIKTSKTINGKQAYGIKAMDSKKVLSKEKPGSSHEGVIVREPRTDMNNLQDNRDLWIFEFDENVNGYLLVNAEVPSMCLVRHSEAKSDNPLRLIPKNSIFYLNAYWNISTINEFKIVDIKYFSTDHDKIEVTKVSGEELYIGNDHPTVTTVNRTYTTSITNVTSKHWSDEFSLTNNITVESPSFTAVGGKITVGTSLTNKWITGGAESITENVTYSLDIKKEIPPYSAIKVNTIALEYKGTVSYEAKVLGNQGTYIIYGKWEGVMHNNVVITISDGSGSAIDSYNGNDNRIAKEYTFR